MRVTPLGPGSWRAFAKRPLFTAAVIAILGLGIGATTAVFSVVNGLLLAPLPYPESERLVRVSKNDIQRGWAHYPVLFRELELWRQASESFEGMAALRYTGASSDAVTVHGAHRTVRELDVTTNYFDVLGVTALYGPHISPAGRGRRRRDRHRSEPRSVAALVRVESGCTRHGACGSWRRSGLHRGRRACPGDRLPRDYRAVRAQSRHVTGEHEGNVLRGRRHCPASRPASPPRMRTSSSERFALA